MRLRVASRLPFAAEQVYAWHMQPGALQRLVPPWHSLAVREGDEPVSEGCLRHLRVSPLRLPWLAYHDQFRPGREFRDTQLRGPFLSWVHRHRFEPDGSAGSWLLDDVEFRSPLPAFLLRSQLRSLFAYRHLATRRDLELATRLSRPLTVAITGSGGLLGRSLRSLLTVSGCRVIRLVRGFARHAQELCWQGPRRDLSELRCDALIHLAGASLNRGNFGPAHRRLVRDSRVEGTRELVTQLLQLPTPPAVVLSASGVNYYGSNSEPASEQSPPGSDFLSELCSHWEAALEPLQAAGVRVVALRMGPVLTRRGGLLPPFYWATRLGLAPVFGSGQQGLSWVSELDWQAMVVEALVNARWSGPVNVVSPTPCSQRQFAEELGRTFARPVVSVPQRWARFLLGRRADLLLQGTYAAPTRAWEWGFGFRLGSLGAALREATGYYGLEDEPENFSFELS